MDQFAGMSMAEIAAAKRAETEKKIQDAKEGKTGPSDDEMARRKARLLE